MFVCLCNGVTSQTVADAVAAGASTTKDVAQACGAGAECGRCRRTVRAILLVDAGPNPRSCRCSAAPAAVRRQGSDELAEQGRDLEPRQDHLDEDHAVAGARRPR